MDVDELRHALGGVVLEAAYLERVLRAAFSALTGSKYAALVDSRLTAAHMIEDCERIARHHTDIPGAEKDRLLEALKACHQANSRRNRVIHDEWATRPGDIMVTLHGSRNTRDVTVTVRTPAEVQEVADRLASAADQVTSAMTAAFGPGWDLVESYVERPPLPGLAGVVRTVWVQRTGEAAYVQRHLPTGGVEIHFPIGGRPQLVGPLTGPEIEVIPPYTTIVGVRFQPGTAPPLPSVLDDLLDQRLGLAELWGRSVERLSEAMNQAGTPEQALLVLQAHLVREFRSAVLVDPLVGEAVKALMPWHPVNVDTVASHLALSLSQLRRRCLHAVGMSPKVLQRTLRFQGFLALAQAGATASGRRGADGMAGLAVDVGYADQAHLSRECLRLTGLTPSQLLGGSIDRCACGHEHSASYQPFLATRSRPPLRA